MLQGGNEARPQRPSPYAARETAAREAAVRTCRSAYNAVMVVLVICAIGIFGSFSSSGSFSFLLLDPSLLELCLAIGIGMV